MARLPRVVIPNSPHHVTQRGVRRMKVFQSADDYAMYLSLLNEETGEHGVSISTYCLMPNHIHLIATPSNEGALAKAIGNTHSIRQ
jgi:putative transposase